MLDINKLRKIDLPAGIQDRLNNLGFSCGEADGEIGPITREAVKIFQESNDLKADGIPGARTKKKLKTVYGC